AILTVTPGLRDRVAESQQDRDVGEMTVNLLHPFLASLPHLLLVLSKGLGALLLLLTEVKEFPLVLLRIKHEAFAAALLGNLGGDPDIIEYRSPRRIVKPIHFAGRDVNP